MYHPGFEKTPLRFGGNEITRRISNFVNAQIEFLLRNELARRGIARADAATTRQRRN